MKNLNLQQKAKNLPKGWRKVKLGEVAEIKMGQSPSSRFYNSERKGLPFFQGVTDFGEKYPKESVFCSRPIKIAEVGEILISVRAPVGEVNITIEKCCIGRGIAALSMKNGLNSFLYFLLRYSKADLKSIAGGTTYEAITKNQLENFEIEIPEDPNEQKRITDILSAFDDKIELNNKINQILEEMAQAIFKHWFVDFKFPGHEKAKSRSERSSTTGIKFVNSELGKIPEGWRVGCLGDGICCEIIKPGIKKFEGEKIYLATADVVKNEIVNLKTRVTYNNRPIRANMEPVLNSIWFAKMVNTYKVLFFFEGNKEDLEKYILSTGFMGIRALENLQYYLYCFINSERFHQIKDTLVQGAVQEAITNTNVKGIKILLPPTDLINEFNKKIEPLIMEIFKNKVENQKLSALRDLLLPKLMSGEMKVKV